MRKRKEFKESFLELEISIHDSNEHDMHGHIQAENSMKKGHTVSSLTGWTIKINYFLFYVQLFLVSLRRCRVQIYEIRAIFPWRELARVLGSKLRDLRVKVIKTDWLERVYNSCFFACPQLQLQQQQQKNNVGYCCRFFSISLSYC